MNDKRIKSVLQMCYRNLKRIRIHSLETKNSADLAHKMYIGGLHGGNQYQDSLNIVKSIRNLKDDKNMDGLIKLTDNDLIQNAEYVIKIAQVIRTKEQYHNALKDLEDYVDNVHNIMKQIERNKDIRSIRTKLSPQYRKKLKE
jgi:hypothetical protein